jgi:hypothetical protein
MTTWLGDTDTEAWESDDSDAGELFDSDVESDFESEDFDAESRASRARQRRAQQRRVALARRRAALAQARSRTLARGAARPPVSTAPAARTASAIRALDLETKVQEDTFRTAFAAQKKRMSRAEYAAVAGAAVNQFIESFDAPDNPYAKAALRFSPLLLLAPQRKGPGFEGIIKDPRVIGGAAVAALVLLGENRNQFRKAREIKIFPQAASVQKTKTLTLIADVVDGRGNRLPNEKVIWQSADESVAKVDAAGTVTGVAAGRAMITATSGEIVERVSIEVTA